MNECAKCKQMNVQANRTNKINKMNFHIMHN